MKKSIKLLLLAICFSFFNCLANYSPELTMSMKAGNQRSIGRASILLPILQKPNNLLYITAIGMHDTKSNKEGNFGLGFRKLFTDSGILGLYGFYDLRHTKHNNLMHQLTFGAEWLASDYEVRLNGYLPLVAKFKQGINSGVSFTSGAIQAATSLGGPRHIMVTSSRTENLELSMGGFDVEYGHTLGSSDLNGYVAYYHFADNNYKQAVKGFRARVEYDVLDNVKLEGEYSYDKTRESAYYGGISIHLPIGGSKSRKQLSILHKKMTQLPVRDIDIVTTDVTSPITSQRERFIDIYSQTELQKIGKDSLYSLDAKYMQTKNITLVPIASNGNLNSTHKCNIV